eukprot:jgi/Mesvir1/24307/Mv10995-RA.1
MDVTKPLGLPSSQTAKSGRLAARCVSSSTPAAAPAGASGPTADDAAAPWLLVGLGNPGGLYHETRHNVGFDTIDALGNSEGVVLNGIRDKALVAKHVMYGKRVILAKPQTFMNLSGDPVAALAKYFKVPLQKVLVIYDDLDLDVGVVRLRPKGGAGGHNGMRSIIARLGDQGFPRIRIGIGRPSARIPTERYVLQKFDKREREEVEFAIQTAIDMARACVRDGLEKAVSTSNLPKA